MDCRRCLIHCAKNKGWLTLMRKGLKRAFQAVFRYIARQFFGNRTYSRRACPICSINFRRVVVIQYSKRMVIAHWLTLAMLVVAWLLGEELAEATDESKATIAGYILHMLAGGTVLLLTVSRFIFRNKDGVPPALGQTLMDKVAKGAHHLLYTLLIVLPVSGMMTVLTSDAIKGLLAGDASLLPKEEGYEHVFPHEVHEVLVTVLIVVVAFHILGAIKHQFIDKDGLMERMKLRRKD